MHRWWVMRLPRKIRWAVLGVAWPTYDCELCVGQEPQQGCYCAYHGAPRAGGPGPETWRVWLRWLMTKEED